MKLCWRITGSLVATCAMFAAANISAQSAQMLKTNPFQRPSLADLEHNNAPPKPEVSRPAPLPPQPRLRSTLAAGPRSLVNVDGEILGLGDEIDGYRLEAVGEGEAIFRIRGKQITVSLADNTDEEKTDE